MKVGDPIGTPYGAGTLILYRDVDDTYSIELPFGILYARRKEIKDFLPPPSPKDQRSMELNVAYEVLEKMRRLNLEVVCQELGIKCNYEKCTTCVLASAPDPVDDAAYPVLSSFKRLVDRRTPRSGSPCFLCGAPACNQHSSKTFRQQKITICQECEHLFTMDFVVGFLSNAGDRRRHMDRLIDAYDRALLLLKFSTQYVDDIVLALQRSTVHKNRVGLGSSATGIVSGVLGVAGAVTILTPAGPPLLLASLLFGGSATAVQTGSDVHQYFMEPSRVADRILSLHCIVHALLGVTASVRDALARDYMREDHRFYDQSAFSESERRRIANDRENDKRPLSSSGTSSSGAGKVASRNARFFSKAGTGFGSAVQVVQVAGGALSAATLLLEAHNMSSTIQQMRAGNPCEKAESLKCVQADLVTLPPTSVLDVECDRYLKFIATRVQPMTEDEAVSFLREKKESDSDSSSSEGSDPAGEKSSSATVRGSSTKGSPTEGLTPTSSYDSETSVAGHDAVKA